MSNKPEKWTQVAIRLPDSFLDRLDRIAEKISPPGVRLTRAAALRHVAFLGADEVEKKKR